MQHVWGVASGLATCRLFSFSEILLVTLTHALPSSHPSSLLPFSLVYMRGVAGTLRVPGESPGPRQYHFMTDVGNVDRLTHAMEGV